MEFEKFKCIEELKAYLEETSYSVTREPEHCYMCGDSMLDEEGYLSFYGCEDCLDEIFCSEECMLNYFINKGYLEEDE